MSNTQNLFRSIVVLIFGLLVGVNCPADNRDPAIYNRPVTVRPVLNQKRPKSPSYTQYISCEYDGANLYVSFAVPEGICALMVTEFSTGFAYRYVFNTEDYAIIDIGEVSSSYLLFETESGYSYEGRLD